MAARITTPPPVASTMPVRCDERGERGFLAIAEARFAFDLENGRNGDAERALELAVGIDESLVEPARELPAERGFARARKTHQKQIAPMQMHRGIVVEIAAPDRPRRARALPDGGHRFLHDPRREEDQELGLFAACGRSS